jgi:hypothetical protein
VAEYENEGQTTISGPSFLGLGSAKPGESGHSSYLLQEEEDEERSHKAGWALLLVLLVLGGVVYARWQPIRDYALPAALSLARSRLPAKAADPGPETMATPRAATPAAPATTVAGSETQAPLATTTDTKDLTDVAQPKSGDDQQASSEGEESSAESKTGRRQAGKRAEKQPAAAKDDRAAANEEEAPAPDTAKPSVPTREFTPPANEGGELVSSGEKYLYGRGVARSCGQAVTYFKAAAAMQNPQAYSHLGALYATGECVPIDRAVAYAWFRRAYAKEPSNRYFEQNLTMLWREMSPDERHRATGRQ